MDAAAGPMDVPLGAVFAAQASLGATTSSRMTTGAFRMATLTINVAAVPGTHRLSAMYGSYSATGAGESALMSPGPSFEVEVGGQ